MQIYLQNLFKYKDLFLLLITQDIKLKYKNSVLGVFWSMLNPLLMMIVFSIVFMAIFKNDIPNFPVYVLIGRVMYQFFSEATNFSMTAIQSNADLIKKVYVPRYYFPLSRVVSTMIISAMSFIPVFLMMLITGMTFSWTNLFIFIPIIYLFFITAGIGLLLAALNVFFHDVKHFYSIVLMVLMYLTPIFYPASIIPEKYMVLVQLNPLYHVVVIIRDMLMYGSWSDFSNHLFAIGYSVLYCILGLAVFYKLQNRFIYHL